MQRPDTDRVRESELALVPTVEVHTMMDGRDFNAITPSIQSKYAAAAKTCFSN